MSALDTQVGGDHYKTLEIQPVEYILNNRIGYMEGCAIKYLTRWKSKGGVEDLRKARHFIDMLIEFETADACVEGAERKAKKPKLPGWTSHSGVPYTQDELEADDHK